MVHDDGATWVLRELRPVSYHFKAPTESKLQRYGFIADEVEATIPNVVRERLDLPDHHKGIVYQDLIAVLAAALQSMQQRLEVSESYARGYGSRLEALEMSLLRIEGALGTRLQAIETVLRRRRRRAKTERQPINT